MSTASPRIVIVGAGPAGIRAAQTLASSGLRPVMIDENARWGGQIYRQPAAGAGFSRPKSALYGFEAKKADAVHQAMADLLPKIDYRPDTLAWSCESGRLDTLCEGRARGQQEQHCRQAGTAFPILHSSSSSKGSSSSSS